MAPEKRTTRQGIESGDCQVRKAGGATVGRRCDNRQSGDIIRYRGPRGLFDRGLGFEDGQPGELFITMAKEGFNHRHRLEG